MNTHKDTERECRTRGSQCGGCAGLVSPVCESCLCKVQCHSVTPECPAGVQGLLAWSFVLLEHVRAVEEKCLVSLGSLMGVSTKKKLHQSVAAPLGGELHHFVGRGKEQRQEGQAVWVREMHRGHFSHPSAPNSWSSCILSSHGVSSHINGWLRPTQQILKQLLNLLKGQCGTWTESHLEHGGSCCVITDSEGSLIIVKNL